MQINLKCWIHLYTKTILIINIILNRTMPGCTKYLPDIYLIGYRQIGL